MHHQIGIVVPTIGGRPEYLPKTLMSIRKAGPAYVLLVGRAGFDATEFLDLGLIDKYVDETDSSLPAKINYGFSLLPRSVKFINWIGDDDLLEPNSLEICLDRLRAADNPTLVYGDCKYIDSNGEILFVNRPKSFAKKVLRFGPQLIPQPGCLYRRDAFEKVGGLSANFGWAFDFFLFISLSKIGKFVYIPGVLSSFRWHAGSLSVSRRWNSVSEASQVRRSFLPRYLKLISFIWELPIMVATYYAGKIVSLKLKRNR